MSEQTVSRTSRFGRQFLLWIIGPLLVLALGAIALVRDPPQPEMLGWLAKEFRSQTGYGLTYGTASSVSLWPEAKLDLRDVKIRRPTLNAARGRVVADANRIAANLDARKWLRGDRAVDTVVIDKPTITLHPADIRQLKAGSGVGKSSIRVRRVSINDGFVSYHLHPANPEFSVSKIQVTLSEVETARVGNFDGAFLWRDATVKLNGAMARTGAQQSDLSFNLMAPAVKTVFKGKVFSDAVTRIEGDANVHVPSIDELVRWLNIDHGPENPAFVGPATIDGPVALSVRQFWLKGADVKTAIASGTLDVAVDLRGDRPLVTGEAAWDRLDLNAFSSPKPTLAFSVKAPRPLTTGTRVTIPSAWQELDDYLSSLSGRASTRTLAPASAAGMPPTPAKGSFSLVTIDFDALNLADGKLAQTAKTLLVGGWEIKDVALDSEIDGGRLNIDVNQASFAGGQWTAKLGVDARAATPEYALAVDAQGVDAKALLTMVVGQAAVEGTGAFNADVSARGANLDAMIQSLSGKVNLDLSKGRLIGFDLKAVLNSWWRKWTYDKRRATPFSRLRSRIRLNKGDIKTIGPTTLRGRHVEIDSSGTVSLKRRRLDQRVRLRLAPPPSQLPIPVRISGLWAKPVVKLDFGLFSSKPSRYEMPFSIDPSPAFEGRTRSVAPTAAPRISTALQQKVRWALDAPENAGKIPDKLREMLSRMMRSQKN
ncbi:MAG: hypothetical protein ACI89J_004704 [Hyphomicrobiaceae bacterium]|jgi:hypothetical protein